jgi:hypothetical protein
MVVILKTLGNTGSSNQIQSNKVETYFTIYVKAYKNAKRPTDNQNMVHRPAYNQNMVHSHYNNQKNGRMYGKYYNFDFF